MLLDELERADISFMPIGHAAENEHGPKDAGGARFLKRQGTRDWRHKRLSASWGIQIYTGIPSEQAGARWHDIDFTYHAICAAPDAVLTCIEELITITVKPLLTMTKSGGLRFSCRVPDYLHPNIDEAKSYIYKHSPTPENPHHRDVYLEILGENGYSRWDARYEILLGELLDPPMIAREILFVPIDALRAALHEPEPTGTMPPKTENVAPPSLGSHHLDLAKEALRKRGFSYLQQDKDFHHWIHHGSDGENIYAWLWEDEETVWVRASAPINGLIVRGLPITDVWDDTGILTPTSSGVPVSDKVLAIREGKLSPLAIKRSRPLLSKEESTEKVYGTPEENSAQLQRVFEMDTTRIIGVNTETGPGTNNAVESYLLSGGSTCLNIPSHSLAEAVEQRYQALKLPSFARWKTQMYRWEQVKDILIDERMANPFQHGNSCEDAERCSALWYKGGDPQKSICPKCPVYAECQQRGYLSQFSTVQRAKAQILPIYQLFLEPQLSPATEQILSSEDGTERTCIIDERKAKAYDLFLECRLPKSVLEKWEEDWQGHALAYFAKALLRALELQGQPDDNPISRVRAAVHAFQQHEENIIRQMCQMNVRGKVVERGHIDAETGQELAHFSIEFESGATVCIPLNPNAEERLQAQEITYFSPQSFAPNKEIEISMSMENAIELGLLDTETVQKILTFPTACRDSNWTYWHQLKRFFAHYKRDTDAPMHWSGEQLSFFLTPVLHPSVKRLMIISPSLSDFYIRRTFPDVETNFVRTTPTAWIPGNRVFQIRTGIYSHHAILNEDTEWDIPSLSKTGERFFIWIGAEIERNPSVKHAIIANIPITTLLEDLAQKENVSFVKDFKEVDGIEIDYEAVDVVWIVGTPHWPESSIWWHAQMLFGNDEEPLNYEGTSESGHYKDERVQSIYLHHVAGLLTRIIGKMGLNHWGGKKVMLLTSLALPDITDRAETFLFDWEDFVIAGSLDKLPEVIATRERFETESANLTVDSSREEVERVLGCSSRQANRVLRKLRGGKPLRVPQREQVLSLLAKGAKRTSEFMNAVDGHPKAIDNVLRVLLETGEIVRLRRGVYALPNSKNSDNA